MLVAFILYLSSWVKKYNSALNTMLNSTKIQNMKQASNSEMTFSNQYDDSETFSGMLLWYHK